MLRYRCESARRRSIREDDGWTRLNMDPAYVRVRSDGGRVTPLCTKPPQSPPTTMDVSFALKGKGYVIVAADTTAARSIVKMKTDEDKIKTLSQNLLMAYSGEPGVYTRLLCKSLYNSNTVIYPSRWHGTIRWIRRTKHPSLQYPQQLWSPTICSCIMDPSCISRVLTFTQTLFRQPSSWRIRCGDARASSVLDWLPGNVISSSIRCTWLWCLLRTQFAW